MLYLQHTSLSLTNRIIAFFKQILESGSKIGLKLKPRTRTRSVLSEETENEKMLTVKVMAVSQLFCSKNYGTDGKQINAVDLERYSS